MRDRLAWIVVLALLLTGCASKRPPAAPPAVAPSDPTTALPAAPAPGAQAGAALMPDGAGLSLAGLGDARFDWAPGGRTALIQGAQALYRLRLDAPELRPVPDLGSVQLLGWAGPDTALLSRWNGDAPTVGELSLLTGEWRPLARLPGQAAICQAGATWVWVDIQAVRQGGAGAREMGPVDRTPVPTGTATPLQPLTGEQVLANGALLGRLADGSCLLDGLDQRLLLLRPDGKLETLTDRFSLPQVTSDGRGVVWLDKAGDCPDCIELGPGVPFQQLTWWRLDGPRLTADLGSPQVITWLLSPDGDRLIIGHQDPSSKAGAIGVLSKDGFEPGIRQAPALIPAGWMGADLLGQPAGPERWRPESPIVRASDGKQVARWLASGLSQGNLLVEIDDEVRYLTPAGAVYRIPGLLPGQGMQLLGGHQPPAPYVALRRTGALLLAKLESP